MGRRLNEEQKYTIRHNKSEANLIIFKVSASKSYFLPSPPKNMPIRKVSLSTKYALPSRCSADVLRLNCWLKKVIARRFLAMVASGDHPLNGSVSSRSEPSALTVQGLLSDSSNAAYGPSLAPSS